MKVYKALKVKKNLISAISQLTNLIQSNNSIQIENEFEFDINELLQKRQEKVTELINLKKQLSITAQPIQEKIFELSELKQELQMLKGIKTEQGVTSHEYSDVMITKKVQITKVELVKMIENLVAKIDNIQSDIDEFNYSTELV